MEHPAISPMQKVRLIFIDEAASVLHYQSKQAVHLNTYLLYNSIGIFRYCG